MDNTTVKRRRFLRIPAPWVVLLAVALAAPLLLLGSRNEASAGLPVQQLQVFTVQAKQLAAPADTLVVAFNVPSEDQKVAVVIGVSSDALSKDEDCFAIAGAPFFNDGSVELWALEFPTKCLRSYEEVGILALPVDPTNHLSIAEAQFANSSSEAVVGFGNVSKIDWGKFPRLESLWLCTQEPQVEDQCNSAVIWQVLGQPITTPDPKDPSINQKLGAYEYELHYDPKFINVEIVPIGFRKLDAAGSSGSSAGDSAFDLCDTIEGEGFVSVRCLTKGKENPFISPNLLSVVIVTPTADDYSILTANQQNGIVTTLLNQECQLSDLQGHPIEVEGDDVCQNAHITIRYLEGDVHADCVVDVLDQQQIAFRWGARLGNLLYNSRFDLEPSAPKKGDGDIDAKDLQFVYGRHGSSCHDPHPKQVPVDPKAKPPVVL